MSRISVSLPEELVARLEPMKEHINVSQACREALERRIQSFEWAETMQSETPELKSLIDRLRQERVVVESRFEDLGRHNAEAWLGAAPYLEIKAVTQTNGAVEMVKYRLPASSFKTMKRDMENEKTSIEGPQATTYKTAWLVHVRTVWAKVIDQLEAEDETADSP